MQNNRPVSRYTCRTAAVFSDIHSNALALKACLQDALAAGADCFIFLGDYVSGLADSSETLDLVYALCKTYPTICIRGNRERYMLEHRSGLAPLPPDLHHRAYLFTYAQLREQDFAFFESLPFYNVIQINSTLLEIAHATKDSDRFYFEAGDTKIADIFPQMSCRYLLTGHAHVPYVEQHADKTIINPGSVGLPQPTGHGAQYALLTWEDDTVTCDLRQVEYDWEELIRRQFRSGLVDYAKYWPVADLYNSLTGKEYTKWLLEGVSACKDITLTEEQIWHQAAQKLNLCMTEAVLLSAYAEGHIS